MAAHLPVVPGNENRIDRHQPDALAHAERGQQVGFAERDDRDVDRTADLEKARLLEMAEHEGVVALLLGLQGVADHLTGAAEFGQRMEGMVGRIEAVRFEARIGAGNLVEQRLQALDIGCLPNGMNEALVSDPRHVRHSPPPLLSGQLSLPLGPKNRGRLTFPDTTSGKTGCG